MNMNEYNNININNNKEQASNNESTCQTKLTWRYYQHWPHKRIPFGNVTVDTIISFTKLMEGPAGGTRPRKDEFSQKHAVDAGCSSDARDDECSNSVSDCCDSINDSSHSTRLADLSASLRIFSESLLRKELTELEMIKSREALRCEAEKRRMELEIEMTQMMVQTQMHIASFVTGMNSIRKRKRAEEDESRVSQRGGALLLSILQCNFIL